MKTKDNRNEISIFSKCEKYTNNEMSANTKNVAYAALIRLCTQCRSVEILQAVRNFADHLRSFYTFREFFVIIFFVI